jgi:PhzF family phenazine biosynthesis protein
MNPRVPLYVVDAFADVPFGGNPAAVCFPPPDAPAPWMQSVAGEMNLSETAFVVPREDGSWGLRWFTPAREVDLCGHATMGAAHVLWETGRLDATRPAVFRTRGGDLTCERGDEGVIRMDFPARPATACEVPGGLAEALGADIRWCGRSVDDLLVELPHASVVRRIAPDMARIAGFPARGVIVTAASDEPGPDFVSRFFAPAVGVPEDPVTGSAHCTLGPFWAARLGRSRLRGWQASRRGGWVDVESHGDRVVLGGRAVTVLAGEWMGGASGAVPVRFPHAGG